MGRIVGMNNIKAYLGITESTVMDAINHQGLPAEKKVGVWGPHVCSNIYSNICSIN